MSYYSENGGVLYRCYLPGHLCKRSTFRDQLVIPSACIPMMLHACLITLCLVDISLTNTRLIKSAVDFGGRRYITTSKLGVRIVMPANDGKLRIAGPSYPQVIYPLSLISTCFNRSCRIQNRISILNRTEVRSYALTIIDHLTRFAVLVALQDKKEHTVAKALVERIFGIFEPPETLHPDQGAEFDNKIVKQLQDVFGYKKTKTTSYRPQGNSVSECMHSTLHAMLSMYGNIAQNNRAEVLPFIQLAHNTYFRSTMHETPFFLCLGDMQDYLLI